MKFARKIIQTTLFSSIVFIAVFILTFIVSNSMLNFKELSNQTIRVLSDWNQLDRITNDILYYRLDSVDRLESLQKSWINATLDLNISFQQLRNNRLIGLLPYEISGSIDKVWYLWSFSNKKLEAGQKIFRDILRKPRTDEILYNIDELTFYGKLVYLIDSDISFSEKQEYQSFLSHMYVLDVTSEDVSTLLNEINNTIPDEIESYIYYMLLAVGIGVVIVILVSFISARRIIRPVIRLAGAVRQMSDADFPTHLPAALAIDENDELNVIQSSFDRMAVKIHALYNDSLMKEKEKRKAQFRALQYQINPHFLYNTLASLQMTAAVRGYGDMAENIQSLSRLLRNTISKTDHFITVAEEMAIMDDYIKIIQMRYKNRLHYSSLLPDDILSLYIPSLILQPLLENAVLHGLSGILNEGKQKARLRVTGIIEDNYLVLTVFDNGKGIEQQRLEALLSEEKEDSSDGTVQIGLKNIHDRVVLLFGSEFGIQIAAVAEEFTRVSVRLPTLKEERDVKSFNR